MSYDSLIATLSETVTPVRRGAVWRRLGLATAAGLVLAGLTVTLALGFRNDLGVAAGGWVLWAKLAYVIGIGGLALAAVERLGRPGAVVAPAVIAGAGLAVLAIAVAAAMQLTGVKPADQRAMVLGQTWQVCSRNIALLSLPVLAGLLWALRGMAPTRPIMAGAVAGLSAGGLAAAAYALHCPEVGMPFVALWYSAGIALAGMIGAALGHFTLRWR